MKSTLTDEERRVLTRIADEPFYLLREMIPRESEDSFFDLLDQLKVSWQEAQKTRINICFVLDLDSSAITVTGYKISDVSQLQRRQNDSNSRLAFIIDVQGNVTAEIDMGGEIEPTSVTELSKMREAIVFWLGADLEIIAKGVLWNPQNKSQVLREIKSKKRDRLLKMDHHRLVLTTHYEQTIRGQAGLFYWFTGKENEVLQSKPERIFQKSLYDFLRKEVDCTPDLEPMFKDHSRCDIRVMVEDYDLYFIEIKWIGYCAVTRKNSPVMSAEVPAEFTADSAIAGAYQTKIYIEENNSIGYDPRIKLGILVVYNGYPPPTSPISYPDDIRDFPLLDTMEFNLVTQPPSIRAKNIAKKLATERRKTTLKKKSLTKSKATK